MTIGENIRNARKAKGMRQEELANKIGVVRSVVSKYENGEIDISSSKVAQIADALGMNMMDLYDDGETQRDREVNEKNTIG